MASGIYITYVCLLVTWLTFSVHAQDPEITENILPEIKRMGTTGRLVCTVINQMDNPTQWIHKDEQTTISSDTRITIDEEHNQIINGYPKYQIEKTVEGERVTYTLVISRLEPRDAGTYTCQIHVRGDTKHPSKDGQLIVLVPPAIVQSKTTLTITIKQGESANVTCDATGYPTPNITWVRVNGNVLPNGKLRYQSHHMEMTEVTTTHSGVFRCLADNNVQPPATHDTTVLVEFQPVANPIQSSYGQAENRMFDVTIDCRVAGWPEPDLTWYKVESGGNWKPIVTDDDFTVNILLNHANILGPHERWFQLVIRSVQANDYGDYICEGRNSLGKGFATIRLFATSECQGPNCPEEQRPEG